MAEMVEFYGGPWDGSMRAVEVPLPLTIEVPTMGPLRWDREEVPITVHHYRRATPVGGVRAVVYIWTPDYPEEDSDERHD
jgi:hypothetical protein